MLSTAPRMANCCAFALGSAEKVTSPPPVRPPSTDLIVSALVPCAPIGTSGQRARHAVADLFKLQEDDLIKGIIPKSEVDGRVGEDDAMRIEGIVLLVNEFKYHCGIH